MSASKKLYSRVKIMFLDNEHLHQAFKIIPMSSMSAASPDEMSSNVSRATIGPIVIARSVFGGQAVGVKFWAMSAIYKQTNEHLSFSGRVFSFPSAARRSQRKVVRIR